MHTTVILCGGRGTRLRPLTDRIPKALVPLNGKPILQHIIESYIRKEYNRFVVCIGYRADMIREFFRRQSFNAEVKFSDVGEDASMLERIYRVRDLIGERGFVSYGDTLIDVDLDNMLVDHLTHHAAVTLTTADVKSPFGLVSANGEKWVHSFQEKPLQTYYVGHMIMERSVLEDLDPEVLSMPDGEGLVKMLQRLVAQDGVRVYPYNGPQITFNTEQDLHQAERDLITFFTHPERE
ncbi:nucleotidyltransferase family protein [Acidobacteria bacterium AH-259-D05]|nr:nucleotidyltransferase family protein [Acidobacteria bacterium AH-259-D05]